MTARLAQRGLSLTISKQECDQWHDAISADAIAAQRGLDALEKVDHAHFVNLCRCLADDSVELVKRIALRKLGQKGDRDDADAEARALEALHIPSVLHTALFALGRVGTERAFSVLLSYAEAGSSTALRAAADQVRDLEEAQQLLALARQKIWVPGSQGFQIREEALRALLRYSDVATEQNLLLSVARLYTDDCVVMALADASPEIIPEVAEIRRAYPHNSVEYKALTATIETLELRKMQASEGTD